MTPDQWELLSLLADGLQELMERDDDQGRRLRLACGGDYGPEGSYETGAQRLDRLRRLLSLF